MEEPAPANPEPLCTFPAGAVVSVCRLDATEQDAIRLKRLGICEGRQIQLVQAGDPLIVRAVGARIGISRRLARGVLVRTSSVA